MPNLTWKELSNLRHSMANSIEMLYKLELQVRDYYRGVNQTTNTCSCLNQIGRIKDALVSDIDTVDSMILHHEAENE